MNMIADPQVDGPTSLHPDAEEESQSTNGTAWLQTRPRGGDLANMSREWLFPEGDELFRGIYTRAGTGFASEVLAVCSAVVGEGKTTMGVGLAVAIAQDFPDRRVLLVETDVLRPVLAEDFGIDS